MCIETSDRVLVYLGMSLFQIGWYNDQVDGAFQFNYPYDTLAFIIISQPCMFEKAFIPYVKNDMVQGNKDPLDQCVLHYFNKVKEVWQ